MAKTYFTTKQKRFIDEYIKLGDATKAVKAAGYSAKSASSIAQVNMNKPSIREEISRRLKELEDETIADAREIMKYLTSVMRGEAISSEIVIEGMGPGFSEAREFPKKPSEADRLKAATLLAKRFGLTSDAMETKIKLEKLQLENEKLKVEIEKIKGGASEEVDDGFIAALGKTAAEVWPND